MNEQDNGPVPGILGAEEAPASTNSSDKLFDDKEIIGETDESKPPKEFKLPAIFQKWQIWAAVFIVIIISSIVVIITSISAKNAAQIEKYDEVIAKINSRKDVYSSDFESMTREFFEIREDEDTGDRLYPNADEMKLARDNCLSRFGASREDLDIVEKYESGEKLAADHKNVKDAIEAANRVVSAYYSVEQSLEICRDDVAKIVTNYFDIVIGDFYTKDIVETGMVGYHMPISIKYKGERELSYIRFEYEFYDREGARLTLSHPSITKSSLKQGDGFDADIFSNNLLSYKTLNKDTSKGDINPKLRNITGYYTLNRRGNNT